MNRKDELLSQIKRGIRLSDIPDAAKYLTELEKDGYVRLTRSTEGEVFRARITKEGLNFLDGGGYAAQKKEKQKLVAKKYGIRLWAWIAGIIAAIVSAWIIFELGFSTGG